MDHWSPDAVSGSLAGSSLVGADAYPVAQSAPPPPISIPSRASSTDRSKADLAYLSPHAARDLSPGHPPLVRSSSPLRPISATRAAEESVRGDTGLVDPEALGALLSSDGPPLASQTSVSRSNTHPRQRTTPMTSRMPEAKEPAPLPVPEVPAPVSLPAASQAARTPVPPPLAPVPQPVPPSMVSPQSQSASSPNDEQFRYSVGDYMLGRTIGAGSMGKVKYGYCKHDKRKVAVKIVPRHTSVSALKYNQKGGADDEAALARARAKDESKEVRIQREGHLQMLLTHPYICSMREMITHPNHYYMVFEHINGGQMLDYIIAHGRLRERAARTFARQIGSALQYCHANNVVHRDLKIENILISKSGNCKLIDFGLSNLYAPQGHLNTYCGSLYFAAPELLNARAYTGPEVDVWSFGVVLYVLVCGKVPFDDQSMPMLHARIKRGLVEYPEWLSSDCKNLLSRMLVTNPHQRATLNEVVAHPWMTKGHDSVEPSWLPKRVPLMADQLDKNVMQRMSGFQFGTPEEIEEKLTALLTSDEYLSSVKQWEQGHYRPLPAENSSTRSPSSERGSRLSRQFSVNLNFYKRRTSSDANAPEAPSYADGPPGVKGDLNPVFGYHPLISIYFLVKEQQERIIRGNEVFNSSDLLLSSKTSHGLGVLPPSTAAAAVGPPTEATVEEHMDQAASARSQPKPQLSETIEIPTPSLRAPPPTLPSPLAPEPLAPLTSTAWPMASSAPASAPTPVFESRQKSQPQGHMQGPPRARASGAELESKLRESWMRPKPVPSDAGPNTVHAWRTVPQRSLSLTQSRYRGPMASRGPSDRKPTNSSPLAGASILPTLKDIQIEAHAAMPAAQPLSSSPLSTPFPKPSEAALSRRFGTMVVRSSTAEASSHVVASTTTPSEAQLADTEPRSVSSTDVPAVASVEKATSKPIFLKGLFSVQTTSRRPRVMIRNDLVRVLEQFHIQYTEIRGGFECVYHDATPEDQQAPSLALADSTRDHRSATMPLPAAPSSTNDPATLTPSSSTTMVATGVGNVDINLSQPSERYSPAAQVPDSPALEPSSTASESAIALSDSDVVFEVFIVKVPLLLGFNGLQFRRVSGNPWQYQTLAKRILQELNL